MEPRQELRGRWMFTFSVSGDLRFISHHDTLRVFQRALARAALPVRFSEGFNPRPRITIPLPRPVGVASDQDAVIVEMDGPFDADRGLEALSRQSPPDLRILGVRRLAPGERPVPRQVHYRIDPPDPPVPDLPERIRGFLEAQVVPYERVHPKKGTRRMVNLRAYVTDLHLDERAVVMSLRMAEDGTAKPSEVAAALGYDAGAVNHLVRRLEIQWQ